MITQEEEKFIFEHSYIPEHLPHYVCSISQVEPFLHHGYVYYIKDRHMIFIGYPLNQTFSEAKANEILSELITKHKINTIATIGEVKFDMEGKCMSESLDDYYRIDLSTVEISGKLRNSIKRAKRELHIEIARDFTKQHSEIVNEYLSKDKFDPLIKYIFQSMPKYIEKSETALIFNGRLRDGTIAGFNVLELGSKNYGYYMFNFISRKNYVPGVSDLLMHEMIEVAKSQSKRYINLGLGINEGVIFFKRKWGALPFLSYQFEYKELKKKESSILKKFLNFIGRKF